MEVIELKLRLLQILLMAEEMDVSGLRRDIYSGHIDKLIKSLMSNCGE